MKEFFTVTDIKDVFTHLRVFPETDKEPIHLLDALGRIIATDITAEMDIPEFARSTMDGYAVCAASTFGASEANPAYLTITGSIAMGELPPGPVRPGEAMRIPTGGMMPDGADGVVMIEHTAEIDATMLEVYRSVPPLHHVIARGEDFVAGSSLIQTGTRIRPQEMGLLAAMGLERIDVFKKTKIGLISTGDEIVSIDTPPGPGQIRDINTYTLSGQIMAAGAIPVIYGIVTDDVSLLHAACAKILAETDMVIISGGSSVGMRDVTIDAIQRFDGAEILVHGIPISPGKPTLLARVQNKALWGLPGHVTSAMVVFDRIVRPFIEKISGIDPACHAPARQIQARLTRNVASAQGRRDFVRVRLIEKENELTAEPILGKSGLLSTMLKAHGLIEIDRNVEGLEKGSMVPVILFS
ncbi:MAG: molybdopterin molybdenumtransferase MoeA [Desulfobacteraceae bacterium]|jgi:molybdopterin molybdotransferase|nr:MAG: molybdopterin molybdenumtransferase MoeA [Desulfobacteraceae bacterium]